MKKSPYFLLVLTALLFQSCEKEPAPLVIPAAYDGANFTANTTVETSLKTSFNNFSSEMKKGSVKGVVLDAATLNNLYTSGNPSLSAKTTAYYKSNIEGAGGWLEELVKSSGTDYVPGAPTGQGGVYVNRLLDENGLEILQVIEKGMYAATLYNHAVQLMEGQLDAAAVDQMLSTFGAHPDFSNTDNGVSNPDRLMALYAARRDKNDGQGLYSQIKNAFIKLQAAVKAGSDYEDEQTEALEELAIAWEKINFATVINYCHAATSKLSATNPDDAAKAGALHDYSEAVGFIHGWKGIDTDHRIISDAQTDELLTLLHAPAGAAPTSYKFITDPVNEVPKFTQAIQKLQQIYGFTDQQIADFRENWVSKQGR